MGRLPARIAINFAAQRSALLAVTCGCLLIRIQGIAHPIYSADAYQHSYFQRGGDLFWFVVNQGRYGQAAMLYLRDLLDLYGIGVVPITAVISTIVFAGAGFFLVNALLDGASNTEALIFGAILNGHPFYGEYFHYASAVLDVSVSFFLAAIGSFIAVRSRSSTAAILLGGLFLDRELQVSGRLWLSTPPPSS